MAYQYVTVKMPFSQGAEEDSWTERLNAVASKGWRLVTITMKDFSPAFGMPEIPHPRSGEVQ